MTLYYHFKNINLVSSTLPTTPEFWCKDRDFNMVLEQTLVQFSRGVHLKKSELKKKLFAKAQASAHEKGTRLVGAC